MALLRFALGVVIGLALGMGVVMAGDAINMHFFPAPRPEDLRAYMTHAPVVALLGLPTAYAIAAFVAALVGARIAAQGWAGWIAGGVLAAGAIVNLVMIIHPLWMTIACAVLVPLAAWQGAKIGAPKPA